MFEGARRAGYLAHTYLVSGPSGVGRRTFTIRMAQALACMGEAPPCRTCERCRRLDETNPMWNVAVRRSHPGEQSDASNTKERRVLGHVLTSYFDLHVLRRADHRRDISVEGARAFMSALHLKPAYWPVRIGIIDGAHELNEAAASALLKSLEEPASHALVVLIAPRVADLLPTIVSRCRVIELGPVPSIEIASHLSANYDVLPDHAAVLAGAAYGRIGWAIRMASDPEAWGEEEGLSADARAFEAASPPERFASVGDIIGGGAPLMQAQRAYEWFEAVEVAQACELRTAMRHNARDASHEDRVALRRAVRRLERLRMTRRNVAQNVTPRLACEELALRPEG